MFTDSPILVRAWRFITGRVQYNVTKSDYFKQLDKTRFSRIMRNQ